MAEKEKDLKVYIPQKDEAEIVLKVIDHYLKEYEN